MATTFFPSVSMDRLQETLFDICLLGPRWQGSEGEAKVRAYIERTLKQSEVIYKREEFEYLAFEPRLADLVIKGSPQRKVNCEVLAYSGSGVVEAEMVYASGEELTSSVVEGKIVLTDALKSYQAYPEASRKWGGGIHLREQPGTESLACRRQPIMRADRKYPGNRHREQGHPGFERAGDARHRRSEWRSWLIRRKRWVGT